MAGTSLDLAKPRSISASLAATEGFLAVVRDKDGNADLAELAGGAGPPEPPPGPPAPWTSPSGRLALDGIYGEDRGRTCRPAARYALTKTDLLLENLSTARGSKGTLSVQFGINGKGWRRAKGPSGFRPTFAELKADVRSARPRATRGLRTAESQAVAGAGPLRRRRDALVPRGRSGQGERRLRRKGARRQPAGAGRVDEPRLPPKWDKFSATGIKAGYNPTFLEMAQLRPSGWPATS